MKQLRLGVVGLSGRGFGMMQQVFLPMEDILVTAVCDLYEDRVQRAKEETEKVQGNTPLTFTDYHEFLSCGKIDAIYVAASWQSHFEITMEAMEKGIAVASEVGGAFSEMECWDLVRMYEKTKTPLMMLENCCYGRDEMMVMNMVKQGVFGELVHLAGGYQHDLRNEISFGKENRHYRIDHYKMRNCENYPTHELGPIAQLIDINRGNRMLSLVAMASKSAGLHEYVKNNKQDDAELQNFHFNQGDIVTTVIKCARGETIQLTLDTTLPRPYSRGLRVQGTKAMFLEDNRTIYIDSKENEKLHFNWKDQFNNVDNYREEYDHPVWKKYLEEGTKGGHDGMDWLVVSAFKDAVLNGQSMPIDVYDMVSWRVITHLSEKSIALGSAPVYIPDFTQGKWMTRK